MPDPPKLYGHSAFVFDCEKDDYLFKNQALDKTLYPARITKLFTCYVALMYLKDINEEILLGDEQSLYPNDASRAWFYAGQKISVDALLHGALMPSGSDATYALAAAAGKKILNDPNATGKAAVAAFMEEMNKQAKLLGMGNTHFVTPDGYHDDQHVISFHAFVTIARCAMNNPHILSICGKASATISYTGVAGTPLTKTLYNSNKLLDSGSSYYIAQAVGLKTGTTPEAGCCFLGVFIHKGKAVIIGVFGCSSDDARWKDIIALWNYYLALDALL
jgi:D-alanyl-D-alanine carboxypeptidase